MSDNPQITYRSLNLVDRQSLLTIVNKEENRSHLVNHNKFTLSSINAWIEEKLLVDAKQGCKVRAIESNSILAGWCGIQFKNNQYEIAIVLDQQHWGLGTYVFKDMLDWAAEFNHQVVHLHFLHTRPPYRFLEKLANRVFESELLNQRFLTYELDVDVIQQKLNTR